MRALFHFFLFILCSANACLAATLTVNTLADELDVPSGPSLSLREAVRDAATGDTIQFEPSLGGGTIVLSLGQISAGKNLTIDAMSLPAGIALKGSWLGRVFSTSGTVTLRGLKITGGSQGVYSTGNLTMENCSISGCGALSEAAAINHSGQQLTLRNCSITSNDSRFGGAGTISILSGSARLVNCTVANNNSVAVSGIRFGGTLSAGTLDLIHCTVAENRSTAQSPGISIITGTLRIQNSVVADNWSGINYATPLRSDLTISSSSKLQKVGQNFLSTNLNVSTHFPAGATVGTPSLPLDPLLSQLDLHGGRTFSRFPLSGSPPAQCFACELERPCGNLSCHRSTGAPPHERGLG